MKKISSQTNFDQIIYLGKMEKNYLLVKYEDLLKIQKTNLQKNNFIGDLLKLNFFLIKLIKASFDKLEKMEKDYGFTESNNIQ